MTNITDADKILRNDTGKDIVDKLEDIVDAIGAEDNTYTKTESDEKFATKTSLSEVATTGDYNDLLNKPSVAVIDDTEVSASKVYSSNKVNSLVGDVQNEVTELNSDVYGGYTPNYKDGCMTTYNNKAVVSPSTAWVYVVVDVSEYVGKTLTVSTYCDRPRPMLFTDDSDNIISSVAPDTGNPNNYTSTDATVPTGAKKLYVNKYATGVNDVAIAGYKELKLALKTEVPIIDDNFGNSVNKTVSQKFITDNFKTTIEGISTVNNKIPVLDEAVPIYLDNIFRGVTPKNVRLVSVNNARVLIYDNEVALLPVTYSENARIGLSLIDDFKKEVYADLGFKSIDDVIASRKVLFIGDSITENLSYLSPLKDLSDNGNYNLTFLGTQGTTIKHEGRSGWAAYNYCNDASFSGKSNAFWDGSKFNFAWYISQNSIEIPDFVFICLGTNDLIRGIVNPNDDDEVRSVVISSYETMINSIRDYNANLPIILWLPPTRCMVGRNNHTAIDNSLRINKFLVEKFDKNSYINSKVYLMHTYLFVNPYTDYTISNITINGVTYEDCSEPIHPTQSGGGEKIAKGIMRQLQYIEGL